MTVRRPQNRRHLLRNHVQLRLVLQVLFLGLRALNRIANTALDTLTAGLSFDQVVSSSLLHGLDVNRVIALAGHDDNGSATTTRPRLAHEFEPVPSPQAVIHQVNVVPTAKHRCQAGVVGALPFQIDGRTRCLGQQVTGNDEAVFVVVDEKNLGREGAHWFILAGFQLEREVERAVEVRANASPEP